MKAYFLALLNAAISGAGKGAAAASDNQMPIKEVGIAAGAAGVAGILGYILMHPTSTPAIVATVATVAPSIVGVVRTAPAAA
jgi:hypothetical protein